MFCRTYLPVRVFPRFLSAACFRPLSTGYLFSRALHRSFVFPRFVLLIMFWFHEFHFCQVLCFDDFYYLSNLCIVSSLEIAYFNPNTKDVIPGVSPQILQIKVQRTFHCILTNFKNVTVTTRFIGPNTIYRGSTFNFKSNKISNKRIKLLINQC